MSHAKSAERVVRDIRRKTRRSPAPCPRLNRKPRPTRRSPTPRPPVGRRAPALGRSLKIEPPTPHLGSPPAPSKTERQKC